MHFTSPRFAVGICIPQRRVVLDVGFSRPRGKALMLNMKISGGLQKFGKPEDTGSNSQEGSAESKEL